MFERELQNLGLTDREARVYTTLIRVGSLSTGTVARRSGINRGSAYTALHSLLEKGLVRKSIVRGKQEFSAVDPQVLDTFVEERMRRLDEQRKTVASLAKGLAALRPKVAQRASIHVHEGVAGARTALNLTLTSRAKTLCAFLSLDDLTSFVGAEFFSQYTSRRMQGGRTLHAIRTRQKDRQAADRGVVLKDYLSRKRDKRVVRYIDESLAFPVSEYIFDDKVIMISTLSEGLSVVIESEQIAAMQKRLFGALWERLK